jgi:hypothetical protein
MNKNWSDIIELAIVILFFIAALREKFSRDDATIATFIKATIHFLILNFGYHIMYERLDNTFVETDLKIIIKIH